MQIPTHSIVAAPPRENAIEPSRPVEGRTASPAVARGARLGPPPLTEEPAFRVEISEQARALREQSPETSSGSEATAARGGEARDAETGSQRELDPEQLSRVRELQQRDAEVRAHENAHSAAGGALAGAPSYEYEQGPDGRRYAVGGEVSIRIRAGATPEETLRIAQQVRTAALAPSEPSSADLGVAASATSLETQARAELAQERLDELTGSAGSAPASVAVDPRVRDYGRTPASATEPAGGLDLFA